MKNLAGVLFVYNGNKFDYCYMEAVECLCQFCDHVIVVAGGIDNTFEDLKNKYTFTNNDVTLIRITEYEWQQQTGKEKLNWFTNVGIFAAEQLDYNWFFNLQADEILHEKSYDTIRKAIEEKEEGFMCSRINLWKSPYLQLNVSPDRLPCSTNIVRLAKTKYRSYGDAESIAVDNVCEKYVNDIRIYHMGFVRDRKIMKDKIIHIQEQVFGVDHDKKLDGLDYFEPDRWFDPQKDLKPIDEPLPLIIQDWAKERHYKY